MYKFRICYEGQGQGCGFDSFIPAYNAYLALLNQFQDPALLIDKDFCKARVILPCACVKFWLEIWSEEGNQYNTVFNDDIYSYICDDIENVLIENGGKTLKGGE